MQGEGPPSAADVKYPHAGGQTELAGHQIAFGVLSHGQACVWCRPVSTRVRHRLTQYKAVEIVADVIVVAYCCRVATLVVPVPAGKFGFFARRLRWRADDPKPQRRLHHGLLRLGIDPYTGAARGKSDNCSKTSMPSSRFPSISISPDT